MDSKELDYQVRQACSYEALPYPSDTQWSDVESRPSRPASAQSVTSSDVINIAER